MVLKYVKGPMDGPNPLWKAARKGWYSKNGLLWYLVYLVFPFLKAVSLITFIP